MCGDQAPTFTITYRIMQHSERITEQNKLNVIAKYRISLEIMIHPGLKYGEKSRNHFKWCKYLS